MTNSPHPLPLASRLQGQSTVRASGAATRNATRDGNGNGARVTRLVSGPAERYAVQGTLALDLRSPATGLPETPELDARRRSRVEHLSDAEVRAWAARLAQAVVETVGGRRPVSQLVRWTTPGVYRDLERRVRVVSRALGSVPRPADDRGRPQVRSVHVCRPTASVAEVSVHVRHADRSRALAMRLERRADRWLCTVLEFG